MTRSDDPFENLTVRSIHGELDDEQALQLNREMIRNPRLREMHDDFAAVDRLASAALVESLAPRRQDATGSLAQAGAIVAPSRGQRGWALLERWFVPAAAAAAIMIAVIFPAQRSATQRVSLNQNTNSDVVLPHMQPPRMEWGTPVSTNPTNVKRNTSRDVIGVIDRDGKVWILELDRTQTLRIPGGAASGTGDPDGL
ncbi:MAG: hypothetical protein IT449_12125 [Phycisphaerales bacterium]|nr:hypothetical protein [Phycisphaerales bacterium]